MATQINEKQAFAYAELLEILGYMEKKYVEKIPNKLMEILKKNASTEYINHIDVNIPLEEQQISEKTSALLAMLTLNYWCSSEEEKQKLTKMYNDNEVKYQEELRQKYNPENIFNTEPEKEQNSYTENATINNSSNLPLDYNSLSWYKKIFNKVKTFIFNLFNKNQQNT